MMVLFCGFLLCRVVSKISFVHFNNKNIPCYFGSFILPLLRMRNSRRSFCFWTSRQLNFAYQHYFHSFSLRLLLTVILCDPNEILISKVHFYNSSFASCRSSHFSLLQIFWSLQFNVIKNLSFGSCFLGKSLQTSITSQLCVYYPYFDSRNPCLWYFTIF